MAQSIAGLRYLWNIFFQYVTSRQKQIIINMFKDTKDKTPDMKYQEMISEISRVSGIGRRLLSLQFQSINTSNA